VTENTLRVIRTAFVEAVHVQLADEGVHLAVAEVSRKDYLLELVHVLDHELRARGRPVCYLRELVVLNGKGSTLRISKVLAMKPATSVGSFS
jgi:hypothetical protein